MRKHFLILMLLTLLPYVAWATQPTAAKAPALVATAPTYDDGAELVLITAGVLKQNYNTASGDGFHYFVIKSDTDPGTPSISADGWTPTPSVGTGAGKYYLYYYISKDGDNYDQDGDVTLIGDITIQKRDITSEDFSLEGKGTKPYDGVADYDAATFAWTGGVSRGTVLYKVGTSGGGWVADMPKAVNAGTYNVRVKITGDENHNDYTSPTTNDGTWGVTTIEKINVTITQGAVIDPVTYDTYAHELIKTAPTVTGVNSAAVVGTFTYKWTTDVENTATAITDVKATNVKEGVNYPITWTFVPSGDDATNYNAITEDQTLGTAIINKSPVLHTGSPQMAANKTYNGAAQKLLKDGKFFSGVTGGYATYYWKGNEAINPKQEASAYSNVKATNADTYTVSYKFFADNSGNYKDDENETELGTVIIAQKSLTVSASTPVGDFTYGTPIDAYPLIKTSGWVSADNNDETKKNVLFGLNDTNRLLNVTMDGEAFNAETVYSAGTHQFAVEVADPNKSNYTPDFMNQVITLTIKAKAAKVTAPTAASVVAFNNDFQTLIAAGTTTGGTLKYAITSVDGEAVAEPAWSTDLPTAKDAGSYVVSYKLDGGGDYEDQAAVALDAIVIPTAAGGAAPTDQTAEALVYSGKEISLIQAGANTNGKWMYQLDGGDWTETVPVATDVKADNVAYLVNYKFVADKNYTNVDALADAKEVKITQATNAITSLTIQGWTFSGAANNPKATANFGTPVFTYLAEGSSVYSETVPTAAGTHTVKASVAATDNYAAAESTTTFVIDQAGNKFNTLTIEGWTFSEAAKEPTATANYGIETVVYTYSVKGADAFSSTVPTDAGEYTVKAYIAATGDYAAAEATADFTISKATATVTPPTANTLTFNGNEQSLVAAGLTDGGTLKYSLNDEDYTVDIPTGMNAGNYTVYYKVEGGNNYNNVAAKQVSVTINQKSVTPVVPTAIALSYNGLEQALVNAGSAEGATIQYALGEGKFGDAIPTAKDAGTYTVKYKFNLE